MTTVKFDILKELMEGVDILANLVKSTLGPKGRLVLINKGDYDVYATKDGVTVANEVDLGNSPIGTGASLMKQAARRTVQSVGDGTTTATAIAQELLKGGLKKIESGTNPVDVKREINTALGQAVDILDHNSIPASDAKTLIQVATVSTNNDAVLGELIGNAVFNVGKYGDVKVEANIGGENEVRYVKGYTIDRGYDSPFFVDSGHVGDLTLTKCLVALYDQKIYSFDEVQEVVRYAVNAGKPLVIVAHSFDDNVLSLLVANQQRGYKITPIQSAGVGAMRREILKDLATLSGGQVLPSDEETTFCIGEFESIIIRKTETTFIDGYGDTSEIEKLIQHLKSFDESNTDSTNLAFIRNRLSKLVNGVAVLSVGAETPLELSEVLDRVDDAVKATRAAFRGGVVIGGGIALLHAADDIANISDIAYKALSSPIKIICENGGYDPDHVLNELKKYDNDTVFNALIGDFEYAGTSGIYDPLLVVISAIKSAESVVGIILNSAGIIYAEAHKPFEL